MNRILLSLFFWYIIYRDFTNSQSISHYTCPSNEDCVKDCRSTSCVDMVIQAANAANLHVMCSNNYCARIEISCPYDTRATCEIDCDANGCQNAVINYPQPQNVVLKCSGSSACSGLKLSGPDTFSGATVHSNASIECNGISTCKSASFDLSYVESVNILCKYTSSTTPSCDATTVHVDYSSNVVINCNYYDCSGMKIYGKYVSNQISLNCNAKYACQNNMAVHTESANHFTLQCIAAAADTSCKSINLYPNKDNYNANVMSCAGAGCFGVISVHPTDDYVLDYFDFVSTTNPTTFIHLVRFICSTRGTSNLFYNTTTQQFECDVKRCCPWMYGDIVCDGNNQDHGSCTIDCVDLYGSKGCANKVIDAVNATQLNVICNSTNQTYGGCEDSIIFCPRNMVHKYGGSPLNCQVDCIDPFSCYKAEIYSYENDVMDLFCSNYVSCAFLQFYGDDTKRSNVKCTATHYFSPTPTERTLEFESTSFTDSNLDGWKSYGNSGTTSFVSNSYCPDSSNKCIMLSINTGSSSTTYYRYLYKSFDMSIFEDIKLNAYFSHNIYNKYSSSRGWIRLEVNCGAGWGHYGGPYCDQNYNYCYYTSVTRGTVIHRQVTLPAICNYNPNVVVRFYFHAYHYVSGYVYINNVQMSGVHFLTGSCDTMDVYANNQNQLNFICNGTTACRMNTIYATNAINVTTTMIGSQSDNQSVIYAQNSNLFEVSCGSRYSAHFVDACWGTTFYGNNISNTLICEAFGCDTLNFYSPQGILNWDIILNGCEETQNMNNSISEWTILCGNDYQSPNNSTYDGEACSNSNCNCQSLRNAVIQSYDTVNACELEKPDIICPSNANCRVDCSTQTNGCSTMAISGANSTSLTVLCNSNNVTTSCFQTFIYCPFDNDCKVKCSDINNACYDTEIYVGINQDFRMDCEFAGSCNDVTIYANLSQDINMNCYEYNSCNNSIIYANISNNIQINCYKDNSCSNSIIYGYRSVDININCYSNDSCNSITVYGNNSNQINLNCYEYNSCNNIIVYGEHIYNLTLNCLTNYACNYLSLYATHASIANIQCYSYNSNNEPSCNELSLFGAYISSYINWYCYGGYACSHNEIHGENATYVNLLAFGDKALYYGHVFATNAGKYNLTCSSDNGDMWSCFSSTMQGPAKDIIYPYKKNAYLNCFGRGCYSLNLDSDSGFDDWIISLNACGICTNITTCFDYWYLTCSDLITLNDHWKLNYFYGDSCKYMGNDDACKCVAYIDILNSNSYNNDKEWFCNFKIPINPLTTMTYAPTTIPTPYPSKKPSNNPSNNPSYYPSNIPTYNPSNYPTHTPIIKPTNNPVFTQPPTNFPSSVPVIPPIKQPTNNPAINQLSTNNPTLSSNTIIKTTTLSGSSSTTKIIDEKSDVQSNDSIGMILQKYYLFILIGAAIFICCVFLCCAILIWLYCKKDRQFKKVLKNQSHLAQSFDAMQNNIELTERGTKANKKLQYSTISKSKYKEIAE
eukprot:432432_1